MPLFEIYFLWFYPAFGILIYINFEVVRHASMMILSSNMRLACRVSFAISSFCLVPVCLVVFVRLSILRGCHALASFFLEPTNFSPPPPCAAQ